jgi:biotin carboxyl carrier protein
MMPEYNIRINNKSYTVSVGKVTDDSIEVILDGRHFVVEMETPRNISKTPRVTRKRVVHDTLITPDRTSSPLSTSNLKNRGDILSPLPGVILKLNVKEGESVHEGQTVAIMEAMKMENEIESHIDGTVKSIHVKEGENVLENALLMTISGA